METSSRWSQEQGPQRLQVLNLSNSKPQRSFTYRRSCRGWAWGVFWPMEVEGLIKPPGDAGPAGDRTWHHITGVKARLEETTKGVWMGVSPAPPRAPEKPSGQHPASSSFLELTTHSRAWGLQITIPAPPACRHCQASMSKLSLLHLRAHSREEVRRGRGSKHGFKSWIPNPDQPPAFPCGFRKYSTSLYLSFLICAMGIVKITSIS